eukprot:Ihof_evm3s503 gene=Ihof_evmTU3s503
MVSKTIAQPMNSPGMARRIKKKDSEKTKKKKMSAEEFILLGEEKGWTLCVALYTYVPRHVHDIPLREGSTAYIVEAMDEEENTDWWKVGGGMGIQNEDNLEGYVPATYLLIIPPKNPAQFILSNEDKLNISEDLICSFCQCLLDHSIIHVPCGGVMCARCLWKNKSECPECHKVAMWAKETRDSPDELKERIGMVELHCPNCHLVVKYSELLKHRTQFCVTECPEHCGFKSSPPIMDLHLDGNCRNAPAPCMARDVGCPVKVRRASLDKHLLACTFMALQPTLASHQDQIYGLNTQ